MQMTVRDWGLLILLSFLWGGAFFLAAVAVREVPPLTIVLARTGIAALVLAAVIRPGGDAWPLLRRAVPAFAIMGLLNNLVPFSLLFWAQTMIPSGLAAILNATTPIFSILVAHVVLADERMTAQRAIGIGFGFLGVVVLIGHPGLAGEGLALTGMLACLGAALSYGVAASFGRRFRGMGLSSAQVALGQLTATAVMMIPVAGVIDRPWALAMPGLPVIGAVVALAVVSTALAYVIFFRLLASVGAVNTALVTLLIPPSAIVLGWLFLDERLGGQHYAGMALIGLGLLAVDGRVLRRLGWVGGAG